jgi:ankyrin repeat protein
MVQDNSLCSALHYVVEVNDIHAACLLMEHGCNMYLSNNDNSSPFDIAVSCGKQHFYAKTVAISGVLLSIVLQLTSLPLLIRISTTPKDNDEQALCSGVSPLLRVLSSAAHYVVEVNDIHAACLLMEHGCNMYLSNNDNSSPFDIAVSCGKQHFYLAIMFFVNGFYSEGMKGLDLSNLLHSE